MKFTTAWAETLSQNAALKWALVAMSITTVALGAAATKLSVREAIVIDRGCTNRLATKGSEKVTEDDVKAFLKEMIPARFNSGSVLGEASASAAQVKAREVEQAELNRQGMRQVVLPTEIKVSEKGLIRVEADRLISVGKVRSAFPFPLDVTLESTTRSESNPYGLVLTSVVPAKDTAEGASR